MASETDRRLEKVSTVLRSLLVILISRGWISEETGESLLAMVGLDHGKPPEKKP